MSRDPDQKTEKDSPAQPGDSRRDWLLGVTLTVVIAALSFAAAGLLDSGILGLEVSPFSPIILAILFGAATANLGLVPAGWHGGLKFCTKVMLQIGIVLLGFRLSLTTAGSIGLDALPLVLGCIAVALLVVTTVGRLMRLPSRLTGLIAIGTSICGCTAIVAVAPLIRAREEEVSYAIAVVAIFGMLAMLGYPWLAHLLFADAPAKAGFFLGTAIHDTSQVAGAALIYADQFLEPRTLDVATVTKLVRNLMMVLLIPLVALLYRTPGAAADGDDSRQKILGFNLLPPFILAFVMMSALRSWGDVSLGSDRLALGLFDAASWQQLTQVLATAAKWLLAIAMAAVGLTTRLAVLRELGLKPFALGLTAAAAVGLASLSGLRSFF